MTLEQKNSSHLLRTIILVVGACLIYGTMQGIHDNYGIMMTGLIETTGISYSYISFCIGVGALLYGLVAPFVGMLALKKSNSFVMILGIVLMVAGLILSPLSHSKVTMLISFGILLPVGTTGLFFSIVMGSLYPFLGEKQAAIVSGIVQASAGVGDAIMSPALQNMNDALGIRFTMSFFTIPFLIMIPIAIYIGVATKQQEKMAPQEEKADEGMITILRSAFKDRDYQMIMLSFGTCGFNMSIIESHLYSQYIANGVPNSQASLTLTVYGVFTMLGAIATGVLCTKFKKKNVLGTTYLMRVFISIGFLLIPITTPFAFLATALLGSCGDSTVPPTTGIITKKFGAKKMAILYGFALVLHQIGAFASATLGGIFIDNGLGYSPLWAMNLCLALAASIAAYRIKID